MTLNDILNGKNVGNENALQQVAIQKQLLDALTQNNTFKQAQSANNSAKYTPNQFITAQLSQIPFQASPSMQQAYDAKMKGYGMAPQPFTGSPQVNGSSAPVKGGK